MDDLETRLREIAACLEVDGHQQAGTKLREAAETIAVLRKRYDEAEQIMSEAVDEAKRQCDLKLALEETVEDLKEELDRWREGEKTVLEKLVEAKRQMERREELFLMDAKATRAEILRLEKELAFYKDPRNFR